MKTHNGTRWRDSDTCLQATRFLSHILFFNMFFRLTLRPVSLQIWHLHRIWGNSIPCFYKFNMTLKPYESFSLKKYNHHSKCKVTFCNPSLCSAKCITSSSKWWPLFPVMRHTLYCDWNNTIIYLIYTSPLSPSLSASLCPFYCLSCELGRGL